MYVPTWAALIIGGAAGLVCYGAVQLEGRLHDDDGLEALGHPPARSGSGRGTRIGDHGHAGPTGAPIGPFASVPPTG